MSGEDIVIFLGGAVTGSLITYALLNKRLSDKHEKIIQEEKASLRSTYSAREPKKDAPEKTEKKNPPKREITPNDVKDLISRYAGKDEEEEGGEDSNMNEGYKITQEEYGEIEEYMQIPLVFYADGTITDEVNMPLDDAEDIFFEGFKDEFKNTFVRDTDTLYFRNDSRKADYEIAFDHRTFEEAMS